MNPDEILDLAEVHLPSLGLIVGVVVIAQDAAEREDQGVFVVPAGQVIPQAEPTKKLVWLGQFLT
jgi:hypothetical protein